ncbi:aldehyde:ferredoxin oxidoreductase, partial [bacterium]|nr:aldehyde:ferredoxin oxidoreductase [bacterium]
MVGAAAGKILRVDLTTGRCHQETLSFDTLRSWLGGRGLGTYLMSTFSGFEPCNPEIPLVFTTGP